MNSKKEVQHVYLVGAKSLGAYGGYETFVYKLTEYHQNKENIKYHVACKANGDGCIHLLSNKNWRYTTMPRTKGSKNKPKISTDIASQIAEKQSSIASLMAETASITANIDTLKADLKEKKTALKVTQKELAKLEAKKAAADQKAAEAAKKSEAEDVLKKLFRCGLPQGRGAFECGIFYFLLFPTRILKSSYPNFTSSRQVPAASIVQMGGRGMPLKVLFLQVV